MFLSAALIASAADYARADTVLTVGPGEEYATVSGAVSFADANPGPYYDINISPGTYTNDFPQVTVPMTIQVDPANLGPVILNATVPPTDEKGIITTFASTTVIGLTLKGAVVSAANGDNGAGIRDQAPTANLTVINSLFINDQDGILADANAGEIISITGSTFESDGYDAGGGTCPSTGCDHALYVGAVASLTVTDSVFCGTLVGHDIKSRAASTTIKNNQLYDGAADTAIGCPAGSTSYAIDLPNAGSAIISGNQIIQGPDTENYTMVSYGDEGEVSGYTNSLLVSNNSFLNTLTGTSIGVDNTTSDVDALLVNDSFNGVSEPLVGPGEIINEASEPASLSLLLMALIGMAAAWRRSRTMVGAPIAEPAY